MTMLPTNPATSLPMTGNDFSGVNVGGSPYGIDIHAQCNP